MASSNFLRLRIINACLKAIHHWERYKEEVIFKETERIINNNLHSGFSIFGYQIIKPNTREEVIKLLENKSNDIPDSIWYYFYKHEYKPDSLKKLQKILDLCNNSNEHYVHLNDDDINLIKDFFKNDSRNDTITINDDEN